MRKQKIKQFEMVKDILIYIATATHRVNYKNVQEHVVNLTRSSIVGYLNTLAEEGYLVRYGDYYYTYAATEKTKQLFGIAP